MTRKETGDRGEKLARDFLKKRGYRIIETNFRCREGEIDIVARHPSAEGLVFVEVRTKSGSRFGTPGESVTRTKAAHLRAAAERYVQTHPGSPESWRIDFVGVELDARGKPGRVELIQNAVGEE